MTRFPARALLLGCGLLLVPFRGFADAPSAALADIDLYAPALRWAAPDPGNAAEGRITGIVPDGWQDASAWAKAKADYRQAEEDGRKYLAVRVAQAGSGPVSLRQLLPDYRDGTLFRLRFRARAVPGGTIEVGVREVDKPWAFLWSQSQALGAAWGDYEYVFTLDHNPQPVGLWWNVKDGGEVDIASLRLEKASQEQILAEIQARYPAGPPPNLLRASRLPLGLQSGWAIDLRRGSNQGWHYDPQHPPTGRDPVIEADPQTTGPSGFPALHLHSGDAVGLWSEPFGIPVPARKYTGSVYVKGSGSGTLVVRRGEMIVARQAFQAKAEWQRVAVPFDTRLGDKFYSLFLQFSGELWADAWQVNAGEAAAPYASQLPSEVSLACAARETGPERIQFADEPARVDYVVTGAPRDGASLHARVIDLYGESSEIAPIPLRSEASGRGRIDFGLFPRHPLGPFRIEAWVQDAAGSRISAYQEVVVHRLPRPRHWDEDAPDSPFGVHADADLAHVTMAKAMGANWVRSHDAGAWWSGWWYLERQPNQWTFADEAVAAYRKRHLKIVATLVTAPPWASDLEKKHSNYFDQFYQPKDPARFAAYARAFAARYKDAIDVYEIWNEPWNAAWFARSYDERKADRAGYLPGADSPAAYAQLVQLAGRAVKEAAPDARVIGLNSTGTTEYTKPFPDITGQDWSLCLDALRSDNDCDILGYHQYDASFQGYPGDAVEKAYQVALGPFQARGVRKPVWMTEGSSVTGYIASGFYHYTLPYTDSEDVWNTANRACRFVVSTLANGAEKVFLYSMATYHYFGAAAESPWLGLVTEEGSLHPAGDAHAAMAWRLEDTRFRKCVPLGNGAYAYLFAGVGRSVAVLAPPQAGAAFRLPPRPDTGWEIVDLFGNPADPSVPGNGLLYIDAPVPVEALETELGKIQAAPRP